MTIGYLVNRRNVARCSVYMHSENCSRTGGDQRFHPPGVDIHRVGIDVAKHRCKTIPHEDVHAGRKGEGRRYDLALQIKALERNDEGDGPVVKQGKCGNVQERLESFLKLLNVPAPSLFNNGTI